MGLRRIEDKLAKEAALREQGATYAIKELEDMIESIKRLHSQLKELEEKYSDQLKSNPALAAKLMNIREELGLPTALGAFTPKTAPGVVDKLVGGGFYEQLALQILDIGRKSLEETGGVISYPELIQRVQKLYAGYVVSISEIDKALQILLKNDLIVRIDKLESGIKVIVFIETEFSPDVEKVIKLAIKFHGQLSQEKILATFGWDLRRIDRTLDNLLSRHIAEKVETLEGVQYYFPGL